jgi:hypothetical protein
MDDVSKLKQLEGYGEDLGRMILDDRMDRALDIMVAKIAG